MANNIDSTHEDKKLFERAKKPNGMLKKFLIEYYIWCRQEAK